jgi:N-methylhydantoinase A
VDAAWAGVDRLAEQLGLTPEACAAGVLEISAWNQANALRQVSVKRGLDVRDFTLVTFGGSGSLLACRLIDVLGLRGALVPPDPGNLSAFGLLTVDVRGDYVRTHVARSDRLDVVAVQRVLTELQADADAALRREGFAPDVRQFERTADLRYFGQAFEVRVDVPAGDLDAELVSAVETAFHAEHRSLYGYDFADDRRQQVEWVNLRVTGVGPIRRPQISAVAAGTGSENARTGTRSTWFDTAVESALYDRVRLGAGDVVRGPAVIEEFGSTVPVHPGFAARVDDFGNLRLAREG